MENQRKELLRAVKAFEARTVAQAEGEDIRDDRVLVRLDRTYSGKFLSFVVALKEVNAKPKFLTVTFREPEAASFIFFSYGPDGKRYFNRKVFDKMADFLESGHLVAEFLELIESEN